MVDTGFNVGPTNAPQQMFSFGGGQGGSAFGSMSFNPQYQSFNSNLAYNNPSQTFLQNSAIGQTSGQATQQGGGVGIQDVVDNASSLNNLLDSSPGNSSSGLLSGLNNSINQFGADAFGLSNGLNYTGAIGPVQPGMASLPGVSNFGNTGATLGGTLGAAGLGFTAGGYLAGLVGGNPTGGSIGGAIGGAIGNLALGSSITTGLGTALGAAGSVLPGVGTVLGIAAGSLLGGMFGSKKKPNPAGAIFDAGFSKDGSLSGGYFGGKHTTDAGMRGYIDDFSSYVKDQSKKYGIEVPETAKSYYGYDVNSWKEYGGKPGQYRLMTYTGNINKDATNYEDTYFDANDSKAKEAAYKKQFDNLVRISGKDPANLTPVAQNNQNASGNVFNVSNTRQESVFDKFLKDYREKQNANLA